VTLDQIPSGQIIPYKMTLSLKDWDSQTMILDDSSSIEIVPYDQSD